MELTQEQQIATTLLCRYGFSVNFINELVAGQHDDRMTAEEKADAIQRNVAHLEIMVAKDFWTTEDLQPFHDAIAAGA
jgi:hypothetical protein